MRITKKFAGPSCIGKQIFQPLEDRITLSSSANIRNVDMTPLELKNNELELEALEQIFRSRQGQGQGDAAHHHPSSSYNHPNSSMFSGVNLSHSSSDRLPDSNSPQDDSLLDQKASDKAANTWNPVERTGGRRILIPTSSGSITEERRTPVLPGFIPFTSASKQPTSIPSNKSNQSISTHNSSSNNSSTGNITKASTSSMMRRAMSAPDLHMLSHSKWHKLAGNHSQKLQGDLMNDNNQYTIEVETLTTATQRGCHQKRKHASTWSKQSQSLSRKSMSMDNLLQFEDYYSDDLAAGLLQYFN